MAKLPAIVSRPDSERLYMRARRPDTGKPAWIALRTRDRTEAERRRPKYYADFLEKYSTSAPPPNRITRLREIILEGDREIRSQISLDDRDKAADTIRQSMAQRFRSVENMALTRDYSFYRVLFPDNPPNDDEALALLRCHLQTLKEIQATDEAILSIVPVATAAKEGSGPKFSQVAEEFFRQAQLTDKDANERRAVIRDFTSVVGDRPIDTYTKEDMRAFKAVLLDSAPNWMKRKETRGYSFVDAAKIAREHDLPRLGAATLKTKRAHLSQVFAYGIDHYDGVSNIFDGEREWARSKTAANQQTAFKDDERQTLISGLDDKLYWLTWIGIATGARLEEITNLRPEDIRIDADIPHFYFAGTKTEGSTRSVPIHAKLLKIGLHPHVPIVTSKARDPGDAMSKAFVRLLKRLELKRPGLSFHSLRHTFVVKCRQANVEQEARERMIGHVLPGINAQYGDDYESEAADMKLLKVRATELAKVKID